MANNFITPSQITSETLRILTNESAFLGAINTEYKDEFAQSGAKVGQTINIRNPVQFTTRDGPVVNLQDVNESTVPLTIQPEFGVDFQFSDYDLALKIDKFSDRYLRPAAVALATKLDMRIASLYKGVAGFAGTPGTVPATALAALNAAAVLDNNSAPRDNMRTLAMNPITNANMVDGTKGLFNDQKVIGEQYRTGLMKTSLGMDFQMSQNMPVHTVGPLGGTPLVNGANQGITNQTTTDNPYQASQNLITDGWTAAAALRLRAGDVFTIAGVFAVNPVNKQNTGALRQFVVTADVSSDASGNAVVPISPGLIAGGAYQNVTALPADNAAITVVTGAANTSYAQNMLFHKDAITLATVDMEVPKGMDMAERRVYKGVSMRFVRGFDIVNNRRICRFDILAGYALLRPEWVVRLTA